MPAAATLSDGRAPAIGIDATTSHRWRTSRDRPSPSEPTTSTKGLGGQVEVEQAHVAVVGQAHDPATKLLGPGQGRGQPRHHGQGNVLDGPRRGLGDRGRDVGRPAPGEDGAGGSGPVGAAQEGAQVAGIGDPVEGEDEGGDAVGAGAAQVVEVDLGDGRGVGQHPLGRLGGGLPFEHDPGRVADGDAAAFGLGHDLLEDGGRVDALGQPHVVDLAPARPQELGHRLATLDLLAADAVLVLALSLSPGRGRAGRSVLGLAVTGWLPAGGRASPGGRRASYGSALYGRASSSFASASSSVTLRAKVSSDTRIWRALVSMRFSPAERPLSFSRIERFRTTSATW